MQQCRINELMNQHNTSSSGQQGIIRREQRASFRFFLRIILHQPQRGDMFIEYQPLKSSKAPEGRHVLSNARSRTINQ